MQFISHLYYPNGKLKDMSSPFAEEGDWRDTWPALPGKSTLRMNFANHTGEYVTHCHFLKHEDMGMMTTFFVDSATPSPSVQPTLKPTTRTPTVKPSSPTEFPTLAPISGTKTEVTFSTSLSLSNVTVSDIDNDEFKAAFKAAIMSALDAQDFPASDVTNIDIASTVRASHRGTLDSLYSSMESVWRTLYYFFIDEDSLQSSTSSLSYADSNVVTSGSGGAKVSYDILLVLENSIYTDADSASEGLRSILSSSSCTASIVTDLNNDGYSVSSVTTGTTTVTDTSTITDDDGGEEATVLGLALWIVILVGISILLVIAVIATLVLRKIRSIDNKTHTPSEFGPDGVELAGRQSVAVTLDTVYGENNSSMSSTIAQARPNPKVTRM